MRNCWDKLSLMTASIHEEDGRRHCQWSHFSPLDGTLFNKDGSLTYTPSFHCSPLLPLSTFLSYLQILPGRMITLGMIIDGIDDLFTKVYELRADEGRLVSKRVDPREQTSAIRTWKRRLISSPESKDPCHEECHITFASDAMCLMPFKAQLDKSRNAFIFYFKDMFFSINTNYYVVYV